MPQIPLVDEQDNLIGFKERALLGDGDCWRITALWLVNSKNEALITKRSLLKKFGAGKLDLSVAGTLEGHDTYSDTIVREIAEELGVTLTSPIELRLKKSYKCTSPGSRMCAWFVAKEDIEISQLKLQEEEVAEAYWQPIPALIADMEANPGKYSSAARVGAEVLKML